MDGEAVTWLREQITERLLAARALDAGSRGDWEVSQNGDFDYTIYPAADASAHDAVADVTREDVAAYLTANDPRDTIARCESELRILALFDLWNAETGHPALGAAACAVGDAVRHVAEGYRHWPGYAEYMGIAAMPPATG